MELNEAIKELRKQENRKFDESVDIIVTLKGIDLKKENLSTIINIPHSFKEKKVCGFLSKKSEIINAITPPDFQKYKEKKALKNLVKNYDFFIASAPLMPSVATTFGKILGPSGKMPSPQLGIIGQENDDIIKNMLSKINSSIKIKIKESSAKTCIGKQSMSDEKIADNFKAVYNGIVNMLPTKKENVRAILIKYTMSKPIKVEIK